jgi:putative transposase
VFGAADERHGGMADGARDSGGANTAMGVYVAMGGYVSERGMTGNCAPWSWIRSSGNCSAVIVGERNVSWVYRVWATPFTGMVTVIQRFDSALRLNVHFHTLALDGVYVKGDDGEGLRFLRLPRPTEDEVYEVAFRTAKRVAGVLKKKGRTAEGLASDDGDTEIEPALLSCYDIAGKAPKTRIVDSPRMGKGECAVVVDGFNVYAGDAIDGRDRKRIERMCRYLARPPIAMERLIEAGEDLRYELKKVWRDVRAS